MNLTSYSDFVWGLINPNIDTLEVYLVTKLLNETVELFEVVDSFEPSREKIIDESGDCLWYLTNISRLYGLDIENINFSGTRETYFADFMVDVNMLVGKVLKNHFHQKPLSNTERERFICSIFGKFYDWLLTREISLEEVMEYNRNKLEARHGQSYNKDFYQQN